MTFRRWDIVSVPLPFIEGHATTRRPALVVSADAFHRAHRTCFGAMITTARHTQDLRRTTSRSQISAPPACDSRA